MIRRLGFVSALGAALLSACAGSAWSQPAPAAAADAAPAPTGAAPAAQPVFTANPAATIADNLKASGRFTVLLKAADGSGLTPLLQKPGGLTLFAPTDEAFAAVPADVLASLMKPENSAQLQRLVAYHLVNTRILPAQVIGHAATPVPSVIGKPITVDGLNPPIKINDATVLQAGAPASNGVIYVIDKVLTAPQ